MNLRLLAFLMSAALCFAQSKSEPQLPLIDSNACPFECCQFGQWKADQEVKVFSDWKKGARKQVFVVTKGETVTALSGVHITYKPGHMKVIDDVPEVKLRKGQVIPTYMYTGEGYMNFWNDGQMMNDQIVGPPCNEKRNGNICTLDEGEKEWWVRIKTKSGRVGWVKGNDGFSGADSCA